MKYEFVMYKDMYYVPRANSLCEARKRSEMFKKHLDVEPMIVSPLEWQMLSEKYNVITLHVGNV